VDDVAQTLLALLRIATDVLALLNLLSVSTSFDAEAFVGGVALAVACICPAIFAGNVRAGFHQCFPKIGQRRTYYHVYLQNL
jgi:hypothetical protein